MQTLAILVATVSVAACAAGETVAADVETAVLQGRIDKLAAQGGGTLVVGKGTHLTGALFFKPGVNLHLEEGAVLLGSDDPADYPKRETRIEGQTKVYYPALVNADGCDGFRVTGKGVIDGHGYPTWKKFWRMHREAVRQGKEFSNQHPDLLRPRLFYVSNSKNVDVSGVTFRNSKFWTTHYYRCENVFVHDCTVVADVIDGVRGPSTDAIDLDVVRHVVISNVVMDVNDDAVVLKGGKGPWADDPVKCPGNGPNSDVLIVDCLFKSVCHQCLCFGSECVKGSDVTMRDCRVEGAAALLRLKMRPDTPQLYENVTVERISGDVQKVFQVDPWTQFYDLKDRKDRPMSYGRKMTLRDLDLTCDRFFKTARSKDYELSDFTFERVKVRCRKNADWDRGLFKGLKVEDVLVERVPDPCDYKELVVRDVVPERTVPTDDGCALVDFGKDAIGWLEIGGGAGAYEIVIGEMTNAEGHVANPHPGSTIRVQTLKGMKDAGWHRPEMKPDRWNLTGYDPKKSPAIRLPERIGLVFPFRYAEIVRFPSEITCERFVQKAVNYPIDMTKSAFACSDEALVRVYEFCKYSVLATSFCGIYVDGDRERTPYEADAYINQLAHYAIDDDCSMARRSFEWLMAHPTWPTEWNQHMVMMAWADWMWTGDTRAVAKFYDALRDEKLLTRFARASDGLLETGGERGKGAKPGAADIVDWPVSERDGFEFRAVNAVVNAFHYRNLCEMRDLAAALGKAMDAEAFAHEAVRVRAAYENTFLDPATGLYLDGEGAGHSSVQANAAALAFGLVPESRRKAVAGWLISRGMACSTYFAQYLLEALFGAGYAEEAIGLMVAKGDRGWLGMMDFGSTIAMEAWNVKVKPNLDLNHAWSTAPLSMIARYVLGVTPLEPGFRKVRIAPQPGKLEFVSGTVPTVAGPVKVDVRNGILRIETPVPAHVVWQGCTHVVGTGVWLSDVKR